MDMAYSMHNREVPNRQSNIKKSDMFEDLDIGKK
jgi:hypothetical protein